LKLAQDIENDDLLRCMHKCLLDANVMASGEKPRQRINMSQTAVLAFLFMSPRKTPSGKMLEMLYTEINSNARDVELRCLRAMTAFKDRHDDENAYAKTLPIVLRSLRVNPGFVTSIRAILRKQTSAFPQRQVIICNVCSTSSLCKGLYRNEFIMKNFIPEKCATTPLMSA